MDEQYALKVKRLKIFIRIIKKKLLTDTIFVHSVEKLFFPLVNETFIFHISFLFHAPGFNLRCLNLYHAMFAKMTHFLFSVLII